MFYNTSIEVWDREPSRDIGGGVIVNGEPKLTMSLKADIQPYSSAQAKTEYGFDIVTTNTIFAPVIDVVVGMTIIKVKGVEYDVVEKVVWDEYIEILVNRRK